MKKRRSIVGFFRAVTHRPKAKGVQHVPVTEEFERCVMCGKLTDIPISTPVDFREEEYEVGCGQLCNSCRLKLREETEVGCCLSSAQILRAVNESRVDNKTEV